VSSVRVDTARALLRPVGRTRKGGHSLRICCPAGGTGTIQHAEQMGSAWTNTNCLVLGQRRVDEKSNKITAIPKLLDALELSGTVVAIDAMSCQRAIAEKIILKNADYILAVKENQGHLLEEIKDSFQMLSADAAAEEIDCGYGRVEQRRCPPGCNSLRGVSKYPPPKDTTKNR